MKKYSAPAQSELSFSLLLLRNSSRWVRKGSKNDKNPAEIALLRDSMSNLKLKMIGSS